MPSLDWSRGQERAAWAALIGWGVLAGVIAPLFGEEQIGGPLAAPTGYIDHRGQPHLSWWRCLAEA